MATITIALFFLDILGVLAAGAWCIWDAHNSDDNTGEGP